uniref:Uncharacterized protein n=1 Tax=Spironucleus salmonicida TaxID=348837 RepID=V6LXQ6_9EUKA|eukprot:EST49417.1 Hypothetical protein SS50377_10348 [Spironucleus salmonicida]
MSPCTKQPKKAILTCRVQAQAMPNAVCIFYVQYLPATEVGTTSTATRSSSIDSTTVGVSGTGIVLDDNTILQYIQQYLKWSLVVYMHWEWCLQGYLVYTIVLIQYTTILTNIYSLMSPGAQQPKKAILTCRVQAQAMPKTACILSLIPACY